MGWIADGVADRHFADAGQSNNIAGRSFAYLRAGKALKLVKADSLCLFGRRIRIVVVAYSNLLVLLQGAALNAANGNAANW